MIFDIADEQEYGERTGQLQMGFWVGAGISMFFSGILTDWLGYREFFLVAAICVFWVGSSGFSGCRKRLVGAR